MLPNPTEIPVVIPCEDDTLVGVINKPEHASKVGVVIIVAGGPQYRVGAHRQFVTLARHYASHAVASIRFDHRGTGDSTGELRGFIDMNADIRSAVDMLTKHVPEIEKVVLWGECESATASAFYCYDDPRVQGIFMVNPWIRTDAGLAQTMLKHYYGRRIFEKSFWTKIISGKFSIMASLKSLMGMVKSTLLRSGHNTDKTVESQMETLPLPERLAQSCKKYSGHLLILTSGRDYIAKEFKDYVQSSEVWQQLLVSEGATLIDIPDADHTFSRFESRQELMTYSINFCEDLKQK